MTIVPPRGSVSSMVAPATKPPLVSRTRPRIVASWSCAVAEGEATNTRSRAAISFTMREYLLHFDELDRFLARSFDHHGAQAADGVGLLEEGDVLRRQLCNPCIEVGDANGNVIHQVAARRSRRRVALVH